MDRDGYESRNQFSEGTPAHLLKSMQDVRKGVDEKMDEAVLSLFPR
jgi:hypothetical protein